MFGENLKGGKEKEEISTKLVERVSASQAILRAPMQIFEGGSSTF